MSETEDRAWVQIQTPLTADDLRAWLKDPETLFRINSLLRIDAWEIAEGGTLHIRGLNLSNGRPLDTDAQPRPLKDGLRIDWAEGLKRATSLTVEPSTDGSAALRITDDYSGIPLEERKARIDEVDRSLPQWGRDLHHFFHAWKRWSWFPLWRWYIHRVWLKMNPSGRRVTRWILWITLGEIALILAFTAIYTTASG